MLQLQPITQEEAKRYVADHHRHHKKLTGSIYQVAVNNGEQVVGVAVVGHQQARLGMEHDPFTVEVLRCCTDGTRNACSMLYRACWRAAKALGYRRLITFITWSEAGASLRAAGFHRHEYDDGQPVPHGGGKWSRPSRLRVDTHPTEQKQLWEIAA